MHYKFSAIVFLIIVSKYYGFFIDIKFLLMYNISKENRNL